MNIRFLSIELCGYLDEYFRENPWVIVCDSSRRELYVGFPYCNLSVDFIVIAHSSFDSNIGSEAFDLDVDRFLNSVRKEFSNYA